MKEEDVQEAVAVEQMRAWNRILQWKWEGAKKELPWETLELIGLGTLGEQGLEGIGNRCQGWL